MTIICRRGAAPIGEWLSDHWPSGFSASSRDNISPVASLLMRVETLPLTNRPPLDCDFRDRSRGRCAIVSSRVLRARHRVMNTKNGSNLENKKGRKAIGLPCEYIYRLAKQLVATIKKISSTEFICTFEVKYIYYKRVDPYLWTELAPVLEDSRSRRWHPRKCTGVDRVCVVFRCR